MYHRIVQAHRHRIHHRQHQAPHRPIMPHPQYRQRPHQVHRMQTHLKAGIFNLLVPSPVMVYKKA